MPSFCMYGGHEGQLNPGGCVHITVFGRSEFTRPPAARQIIAQRQQPEAWRDGAYTFFTLFGGVSIAWPTLAEEYLALCDTLRSGSLTLEDWDRLIGRTGAGGPLRVHSFTLFGGFEADGLPGEERELDDLTLQRHLGHIREDIVDLLLLGIGQRGAQRLATVRRAAAAALSAGS